MASAAPVIADIAYEDLLDDPYPIFKRVRDTASAVFMPAANLTLVTRFDDIMSIERSVQSSSSSSIFIRGGGRLVLGRARG